LVTFWLKLLHQIIQLNFNFFFGVKFQQNAKNKKMRMNILFVYSLSLKRNLPNFENILKNCLFKSFLENVGSIRIYPKLSHLGFQIDVMLDDVNPIDEP